MTQLDLLAAPAVNQPLTRVNTSSLVATAPEDAPATASASQRNVSVDVLEEIGREIARRDGRITLVQLRTVGALARELEKGAPDPERVRWFSEELGLDHMRFVQTSAPREG